MLRKPKIRIFFGNLDIENYLKLSFPWNSWVRTVISLKLSCLAWNLSCVKLFWREIIYANECDEAGDPVGGHFRKKQLQLYNQLLTLLLETYVSQSVFLGLLDSSTSRCSLKFLCAKVKRDKLEVKNHELFWPEWTCWNREDNNPLPLTGFRKNPKLL